MVRVVLRVGCVVWHFHLHGPIQLRHHTRLVVDVARTQKWRQKGLLNQVLLVWHLLSILIQTEHGGGVWSSATNQVLLHSACVVSLLFRFWLLFYVYGKSAQLFQILVYWLRFLLRSPTFLHFYTLFLLSFQFYSYSNYNL